MCSFEQLRALLEDVKQDFTDLLSETGRCAPPESTKVVKVTRLQAEMEDLMDIASCTLGASQHGTSLPRVVQGHPNGVHDLCERLKTARKEYFDEARRFLSAQPSNVAKHNLAASAANQQEPPTVSVPQSDHIEQHMEPGGLVDIIVGANLTAGASIACGHDSMALLCFGCMPS